MKRYLTIFIFFTCYIFAISQDSITVSPANQKTIADLHNDSTRIIVQSTLNADSLGLIGFATKGNPQRILEVTDTLNSTSLSNKRKRNPVKKSWERKINGINNENGKQLIINTFGCEKDSNAIILSIDSLKVSIKSMILVNDSMRVLLSEMTNHPKETLKNSIIIFYLFLSIFFIIITIIINRVLFNSYVKKQNDVISILRKITSLISEHSQSLDNSLKPNEEIARLHNQVNNMECSLKGIDETLNVILSKVNDNLIESSKLESPIEEQPEKKSKMTSVENASYTQITEVQYNDAITEFERINNRLFKLRKHKCHTQELLRFLSVGEIDKDLYKTNIEKSVLPEDIKEHLNTILYDIDRFNSHRREIISLYILQNDLCNYDIRFPLFAEFDNNLDHHFKGDDATNGDKIIRVCKLGYYFPSSRVAPYRVKSEVDTEKI